MKIQSNFCLLFVCPGTTRFTDEGEI